MEGKFMKDNLISTLSSTTNRLVNTHKSLEALDKDRCPTKPHIVIIGAGFAGIYAAKQLKDIDADILIIDKNNFHTFQPLLYQVATSALNPDEIAHSVRATFQKQKNVDFVQATVSSVDWSEKEVILDRSQTVSFDYLILATGAIYNDFGIEGVQENAFFLKSLKDAVALRSHILHCFEQANKTPKDFDNGLLNVVIVGGGPTGVEMAGALSELYSNVLKKDFPKLDFKRANIILVEQADKLLGHYSSKSSGYAKNRLEAMGVDIHLGESVSSVSPDSVTLASGEIIPCSTLVWAAGVRAHPMAEALDIELGPGHRIIVNDDLSIPNQPDAFVAGDLSAATGPDGKLLPQTCPVATQQGQHVARQIIADLTANPRKDFKYIDKGSMAIIGRNAGIAELSQRFASLRLQGFVGWLAWLALHLVYLIGFQNRFLVLSNWFYSYISKDRHSRLIMPVESKDDAQSTQSSRQQAAVS